MLFNAPLSPRNRGGSNFRDFDYAYRNLLQHGEFVGTGGVMRGA